MKKIRSYTSIWNVEKVLYAINDVNLPFPVTFTQITWFVLTEFIIILFADVPPLSMIEGAYLKYFGIPVALTWFMSQKTFDGKKPYSYIKTMVLYALRPKVTYAGKAVNLHKQKFEETITAVRSVTYAVSYYGSLEELVEHKDDIILYSDCETMIDVAYYLIDEEQALGEIPSHLQNYIDYEAYGRDLDIEGTFIATNVGICEVLR